MSYIIIVKGLLHFWTLLHCKYKFGKIYIVLLGCISFITLQMKSTFVSTCNPKTTDPIDETRLHYMFYGS